MSEDDSRPNPPETADRETQGAADLPRRRKAGPALSDWKRYTDARVALGRAGPGLPSTSVLKFGLDHARARDAVYSDLETDRLCDELDALGHAPLRLRSAVETRQDYLKRPDLGRKLDEESIERLKDAPRCGLAIVLADGLSALAVNMNAVPLVEALLPRLGEDLQPGLSVLTYGRVAAGDRIAMGLDAKAVLILIGERPGLSAADSLGAYLTWQPSETTSDAQRFCVSNIRTGGMEIDAAATQIESLLTRSRTLGYSGVKQRPAIEGS